MVFKVCANETLQLLYWLIVLSFLWKSSFCWALIDHVT